VQHTSRQTRTDRIHELAGLLRRGVATSVPELALRFGVSERTIARDITFLRDHEMPVKGKPGRYGGLVLVQEPEEALDLSDEEVAALWLAVWTTATRSASGAEPGHSAFVKIERALS